MSEFLHDIAISFAEEQRDAANSLKLALQKVGLNRIYYYPDRMDAGWGKVLAKELAYLYEHKARYAVVFLSKEYCKKKYTNIEYDAMQRRKERDAPLVYMLPIMMCDVKELDKPELEALHFIQWKHNPDEIAAILKKLLGKNQQEIAAQEEYKPFRYLFVGDNYNKVAAAVGRVVRPAVWPLAVGIAGVLAVAVYGVTSLCFPNSKELVVLPAGSYMMGTYTGRAADQPAHNVRLRAFAMGTREVTMGEYYRYCDSTGLPKPPPPSYPYTADHPVVNITWQEAAAYCKWKGGRLPTEAEWEYAGRQNGTSTDRYSGSNNIAKVGYYETNSGGKAHPVAQKCGGRLGIHDMTGNVAEWCADWYAPYVSTSSLNPLVQDSVSGRKVVRGGHYNGKVKPDPDNNQLRITYRSSEYPDSARPYIGFRVVWDNNR